MPVHKVYFLAALIVALAGISLLCFWAPWHQVLGNDVRAAVALPRAPIWAHSDFPGASVDFKWWAIEAALVLALAGLILRVGLATRTQPLQEKSEEKKMGHASGS
jgi:hypothetical protein